MADCDLCHRESWTRGGTWRPMKQLWQAQLKWLCPDCLNSHTTEIINIPDYRGYVWAGVALIGFLLLLLTISLLVAFT